MMFKLIVAKLLAVDVVAGSNQDTFFQSLARQLQGENEEEKNCETSCTLEGGLEKVVEGACQCKQGGNGVLFEPIIKKNNHGKFTARASGQWQEGGCYKDGTLSEPLCFRRGLPKTANSKEDCAKYCVEKVKDKVFAVGYSEQRGTINCKCFFHTQVDGSLLRPNEKSSQCFMIPTDTEVAQGKVDEATDALNDAKAELDSVKTQFDQVEEVAAAAEGEVQSLEEQIKTRGEEKKNTEEEIKRMLEEMEKEKKDLEKKKEEMEKAQAELEEARVTEENAGSELEKLKTEKEAAKEKANMDIYNNNKAKKECAKANDELKTKTDAAAATQKKVDDLKAQLAIAEEENQKAQKALAPAQEAADTQNAKCTETKTVSEQSMQEVNAIMKELKQAQIEFQEAMANREDKERLQDEVKGAIDEAETSIKTMNAAMEEKRAEKETAEKLLAQLQAQAEEKKQISEKAQADLKAAGVSKDKEEGEYNAVAQELETLTQELAAITEAEQNAMHKKKMMMQKKVAMMKK